MMEIKCYKSLIRIGIINYYFRKVTYKSMGQSKLFSVSFYYCLLGNICMSL